MGSPAFKRREGPPEKAAPIPSPGRGDGSGGVSGAVAAALCIAVTSLVPLLIRLDGRRRQAAAARYVGEMRDRNGESEAMRELAEQFIGKECIIYTVTSGEGALQGTIKEVRDGGMIVESRSGELQAVNLDFVTRIREFPKRKNGKKKPLVIGR